MNTPKPMKTQQNIDPKNMHCQNKELYESVHGEGTYPAEADPIRIGPSWTECPKCREEYNTSDIHECAQATQPTHSPLPWRATESNVCIFSEKDQTRICTLNQSIGRELDANASLIVRACNNAENLVEALKDLRNAYQQCFEVMPVAWQTYDDIAAEALAQWEAQ